MSRGRKTGNSKLILVTGFGHENVESDVVLVKSL